MRYVVRVMVVAFALVTFAASAAEFGQAEQSPGQRFNLNQFGPANTKGKLPTLDISPDMIAKVVKVAGVDHYVGLFKVLGKTQVLLFQNVRGRAIVEGDMDFGDFKLVLGLQRALRLNMNSAAFAFTSLPSSAERWPSTEIPFTFTGDLINHELVASARPAIRRALREIEAVSPIRFVSKTDEHVSWIQFAKAWDFGGCPNSFADFGRRIGATVVHIQATDCALRTLCEAGDAPAGSDCVDFLRQSADINRSTKHEVGHALGFKHEHTRPDRDEFISIDMPCVESTFTSFWISVFGNYAINEGGFTNIGPYDFESIMHYPTQDRTLNGSPCKTIVIRDEYQIDGDESIGVNTEYSTHDINALYHMFIRNEETGQSNERFGSRLAVHDLDRDGYDDVVVSALSERPTNGGPRSGAVFIYKGTATGFVYWKRIDSPNPVEQQLFGAALAVGDFDVDGSVDIAIGAPRSEVDGKSQAGAVYIFRIKRNTVSDLMFKLTNPLGVEEGDRFGASLAVGRFFHLSSIDSLVQRERRRPHLAIGSPGSRAPGVSWRPGFVWFWHAQNPEIFGWPDFDARELPWAGGFGSSIATVTADGLDWMQDSTDGSNDFRRTPLAVTASHDDGLDCGEASVYLIYNPPGGGLGLTLTERIRDPDAVPVSEALCGGARTDSIAVGESITTIHRGFGRALAVGDFNGDGRVDIAIGDPDAGATINGAGPGYVYLFSEAAANTYSGFSYTTRLDQSQIEENDPADAFGSALSVHDLDNDGKDDLLVGTPGEDDGEERAGAVFAFRGCDGDIRRPITIDSLTDLVITWPIRPRLNRCTAAGLRGWKKIVQAGGGKEENDFFGVSLGVVNVVEPYAALADDSPDYQILVGTPGETRGSGPNSGYVHRLNRNGSDFTFTTGIYQEMVSSAF